MIHHSAQATAQSERISVASIHLPVNGDGFFRNSDNCKYTRRYFP